MVWWVVGKEEPKSRLQFHVYNVNQPAGGKIEALKMTSNRRPLCHTRAIIGSHCWNNADIHQHTLTHTHIYKEHFSTARQLYFDILRKLWQFAFCQLFIQRAAVHFISKHVALKHTQTSPRTHLHSHTHTHTRTHKPTRTHSIHFS